MTGLRRLRAPQSFWDEVRRADGLARMNRQREAEAAFRQEIESFPHHLQAYRNLAFVYTLQGRVPERDRLVAELIRENPRIEAMASPWSCGRRWASRGGRRSCADRASCGRPCSAGILPAFDSPNGAQAARRRASRRASCAAARPASCRRFIPSQRQARRLRYTAQARHNSEKRIPSPSFCRFGESADL